MPKRSAMIEDLVSVRDVALARMDMDYLRIMLPDASNDAVRIIAAHKARLECVGLPDMVRIESRDWLRANGFRRFDGTPVMDELPK